MRLKAVTLQLFRNFVDPQRIEIEQDVTCLLGKNESGKTTILKALHRLKPANGESKKFHLITEYPRWRLAADRRENEALSKTAPITAEFTLDDVARASLEEVFEMPIPDTAVCIASRDYGNERRVALSMTLNEVVSWIGEELEVAPEDLEQLGNSRSLADLVSRAETLADEHRSQGAAEQAKNLTAVAEEAGKYELFVDSSEMTPEQKDALWDLVPSFFYFSNYDMLQGETNLSQLVEKLENDEEPTAQEQALISLLAHAGERPQDFLDDDYDSRKAELQAASSDLSRRVFKYWTQNPDLSVIFDTDNRVVENDARGNAVAHRYLKIELRDGRHGDVETNFDTRSSGFQWFFSFFAAFSAYQNSQVPVIVLLDEPGTSLHGEAQNEFVDYIHDELGASKQTIYTTHSQHMIDPARYEKLRAVHDRATRDNPELGVAVTPVSLSADRATILPVESALGYSVSRHLFIGSGQHLVVEGSSDFVFLQRFTEHLTSEGRLGLDPRLAIISVGGADNMPAFVALLGRRLKVSALVDGAKTQQRVKRIKAAAKANGVPEEAIIALADVADDLPTTADVEDLFAVSDYLRLYNWAFAQNVKPDDLPDTAEPIIKKLGDYRGGDFDHALPAHELTKRRDEFFQKADKVTLDHFEALFRALNDTVQDG